MTDGGERFDLAVVIGRFQPFHYGHLALVERALEIAPRALLIVGSARGPRMAKNPFTHVERIRVIGQSLPTALRDRVGFASVRDYYDEVRWASAVKAAVARHSTGAVALVGFRKDESSSYLSLFPEWHEVALQRQAPIDGVTLRRLYFTSDGSALPAELLHAVPAAMGDFLEQFRTTQHFAPLCEELRALDENAKRYGTGPFVTVDAIVKHGQRVLLVQRGRAPGKGQWALPGGFLEGSERLLSAALRELREETEISVEDSLLRAAFRAASVFDHPQRSQRGRTITHVHYFELPAEGRELPAVRGADDARAAQWVPLANLWDMTDQLFEDHFQIIDHFLKVSKD